MYFDLFISIVKCSKNFLSFKFSYGLPIYTQGCSIVCCKNQCGTICLHSSGVVKQYIDVYSI